MASGLLLGLLVGGPGLFPTYFASARATCTPPTAFVSSALRLVKGYKLPPAAPEEKVTFTNGPENRHVPEFVHRASGGPQRLATRNGPPENPCLLQKVRTWPHSQNYRPKRKVHIRTGVAQQSGASRSRHAARWQSALPNSGSVSVWEHGFEA